jgi:hypothetical protein
VDPVSVAIFNAPPDTGEVINSLHASSSEQTLLEVD